MNSEELKNKLEELNVPGRYYSINSSISSDRYVFRQVHIYWECFYIDERVQHSDYWVINQEADYAVKISGHSMEPKIPDGCIALVKQAQELNNNDVGIFNVDGQSMCKRYKKVGRGIVLVPDNNSGEYKSIKVSEVSSCVIQGKVVEIINE